MQVAAILRERRELAAARAAAQAAATQMAVAEAERRKLFERPSHRSTAWESKVAVRPEKEAAFLEGSSTGHDENAQVGCWRGGEEGERSLALTGVHWDRRMAAKRTLGGGCCVPGCG